MTDLDDPDEFERVLSFEMNEAFTYGNGSTDRGKREKIRSVADSTIKSRNLQLELAQFSWWAFRLIVYKSGTGDFDIDNVPKLFIDAFCARQIRKDESQYEELAFYKDDTIDDVKYFEIYGERIQNENDERTTVEIFGKKKVN